MIIDELTKEYLLRTFDFSNSSPSELVTRYLEIYAEIESKYKSEIREAKTKSHDSFFNKDKN